MIIMAIEPQTNLPLALSSVTSLLTNAWLTDEVHIDVHIDIIMYTCMYSQPQLQGYS